MVEEEEYLWEERMWDVKRSEEYHLQVGDDEMELGEGDPNRCEILFGERWLSLVRETNMLFEVLCCWSEEAKGYIRGT